MAFAILPFGPRPTVWRLIPIDHIGSPLSRKILTEAKKNLTWGIGGYKVQAMKTNAYYIKRLKKYRKAAGLTQAELSDKAGISPGTLAYYETTGSVRVALFDHLIDLCKKQIKKNQSLL